MLKINKLLLTSSLLLTVFANTMVVANSGPIATNDCYDKLSERIKKIEDHAVLSDTKKILLSGYFNIAAQWLSNGKHSNISYGANDNVDSRINVTGLADFNEDMTFGGSFELGFIPNNTDDKDVHLSETNAIAESRLNVRIAEVFLTSKKLGKLSLGRGWMASGSINIENDLSGTVPVADGSNVWESAIGASFYEKTTGRNGQYYVVRPNGSARTGAFGAVGGLSRDDRVRYDAPTFYGVTLSTSHSYQSTGDIFDVAARYAAKIMGVQISAGIDYVHDHSIQFYHYKQVNGSIGVLLPISASGKDGTGINLYFAASKRKWEATGQSDGNFYHVKLGYLEQYIPLGKTAIAVEYANSKNFLRGISDAGGVNNFDTSIDNIGKTWGAFIGQDIDAISSQIYAGYHRYAYKRNGSPLRFKDIDVVLVGAIFKL